jgi:aspartate/methionine/tyrosine aminotransferase
MRELAKRTQGFGDSIFGVMSKMAKENNAINLAQGFPDFDGPEFLKNYALDAIRDGKNQYASFMGIPELRDKVQEKYENEYKVSFNSDSEITITNGATEAIYLTIMGLINPGDEVIVFEPVYDSYINSVKMAGGVPVAVTLKGENDFSFDQEELKNALSDKTKLIIVNTPHNPSGKIFSKDEMQFIADLVKEKNLYLMSDEVYEYLVFDGKKHISFCEFTEIKDNLILISSAGKTFGMTGWKVGWLLASKEVTNSCRKVHQYVTFSISTPFQEAVAKGLGHLNEYIPQFQKTYREKRDLFYNELTQIGFDFKSPEGTYFMLVPIQNFTDKDDVAFAQELIQKYKVAMIPPSAFYIKSDEGKKYLRLCFAKKDETILAAIKNLKSLKG